MPNPTPQPFVIKLDSGAQFLFSDVRAAIKRACALSLGAAKRIVILHRDTTFDDETEDTQLGVVVLGEYFETPKRPTFEAVEHAIVARTFAFHLLRVAEEKLAARRRRLLAHVDYDSQLFKDLDDAETVLRDASERVVDEMTHSEQTANYLLERLTGKY